MTALVTGATGFIGGRLTRRLRSKGRTVRALVRPGADSKALSDAGVELFEGDLGDPNVIAQAARGCGVVFHCAAEVSHRAHPKALAWVNVAGTENVLNASRAAGVPTVVHLSCADVTLDNRDRLYVKEASAAAVVTLNALCRTKLLAEELALKESSAAMGVVVLRPAWVWGAGDTTSLPQLAREGLSGGMLLCGGGDNLVATTHVDNVVDAMCAVESAPGARGKALHVADADHVTQREFLGNLSTALSLPPPRRTLFGLAYATALCRRALSRPGPWPMDVVRRGRGRLLEVSSIAGATGYAPRVTMQEGMAELANWAQSVGGAARIAQMGRTPATGDAASQQQRLADEVEAVAARPAGDD